MERKKIEKIWQEVLQIDTAVEDSDDFFEVGGNSFSALLLVNQLNEAGYDVDVIKVCESRTFGDLLELLLLYEKK